MNDILEINTVDKTPIEISLGIDKDGMTTAKKLYVFLGLSPAVYARWCKDKIINNKFAIKDVDYFWFNNDVEPDKFNPKPTKDYKLTATFAKKLAMTANNERGEEARKYFVTIEEAMKQVAAVVNSDKLSNLNNITFMKAMIAEMETQKNEIANLDERVAKIENAKQVNSIDVTPKGRTTPYIRNNVYSPTSIAKAFGMSAVVLNSILASEGIIKRVTVYYMQTARTDPCWIVTDAYRNLKYTAQKYAGSKSLRDPSPVEVTYAWTKKGVAFIVSLLRRKGYIQQREINNKTKSRSWAKASV